MLVTYHHYVLVFMTYFYVCFLGSLTSLHREHTFIEYDTMKNLKKTITKHNYISYI